MIALPYFIFSHCLESSLFLAITFPCQDLNHLSMASSNILFTMKSLKKKKKKRVQVIIIGLGIIEN